MQPEHRIEDDEALILDIGQVWDTLRGRFRLILGVALGLAVVAGVSSYLFYGEKYQSSGTLLFNPVEMRNIIVDVNVGSHFLNGKSSESSPYKNQEELLKSKLIAQRVIEALRQKGIQIPVKKPEGLLSRRIIEAAQVRGTDFIRISAKASRPELAQKIAKVYLQSYLSLMSEISYEPLIQQKKLFSQQVAQAEQKLQNINSRLQTYQRQYGIIDIAYESQNRVRELVDLDTESRNTEALFSQKQAEVNRTRKQLRLKKNDIDVLIRAVANGQDNSLNGLQDKLQEAQKDYNAKALIYSATNPDMRQLQARIDTLKRQITDQQIMTAGQSATPGKNVIIKDSVRTDLVSRLAAAETDMAALRNKLTTIHRQTSELKTQLSDLPQQQLEYARLSLEQHNQEDILTKLKQKLTEVQIQEAAVQKNLKVIDSPDLPQLPLFPQHWHIIALAGLAGLMLSALAVVGQAVLAHRQLLPEYVERHLGLPVLSVIPWMPEAQWRHYRKRGLLEVAASSPDARILKAYQDLALNLKVQRNTDGKNTLVVASLTQEPTQSVILANLGFCLAQSGERVLLVDTNLRHPRLHESFNRHLDYEKGLLELINSISEQLYRNPQATFGDLTPLALAAAIPSGLHPQLHYLNAGAKLENTFEFLNSRGFHALLHTLKLDYDWVLLDAPPFLQQPDAAVLLGSADALLLLVEHDADEAQIKIAQRQVSRLQSSIVGTVLRLP